MKKIKSYRYGEYLFPSQKLLRIMKLTFIFLLTGLITYASSSYSQATKLSMKMKNATVLEVFTAIENQSEFNIAYNSKKLDVNKRVDVDVSNQTVDKILDKILNNQGLRYEIVDRYIVITDQENGPVFSKDAGQKIVSGKVTNESGEPIPGATVIVLGTTVGTVTDSEGGYSLVIPANGKVLEFSFVGMLSQQIEIANQNTIDVQLRNDVIGIEEVIAVGYATQKKINLSGAVTSVDADKIATRPITQTSSALQGLAPGVVVTQNLGTPGNDASTIRIRGRGSISSDNSPLILVDGIQVENINDVNPEDIASMSVLKDAASAAIYGARAANGVILITTKRGKKGVFSVNADLSYGAQVPTMLPDFVGVERQLLYEDVKRLNEGLEIENGAARISDYLGWFESGNEPNDQYQKNDWYDAVIANSAALHREQITLSGGGEKVQARLSVVNMEQDGLISNSDFERKSIRSNIDINPLNWLRFTTDIFIQRSEQTSPARGVYQMLNELEPYRYMYVGDGLWGSGWQGNNPLAFVVDGGNTQNDNDYTLLNLNAYINPIEGLNIEIGYSNLQNNNLINAFTEKFDYYDAGANVGDEPILMGTQPTTNWLTITNQRREQNYYKAIATYEKTINNHNIKVLFGGDAIDYSYKTSDGYRSNFPLGITYRQLSLGDREGMDNGSSANEWAMASMLGRLNYNYLGKYLLEGSFRYDGSSRFSEDTRWGFFPSVSAGWRISEEEFIKSLGSLTNLKLRASWGQLGNQNIGSNYPYQSLVDLQQPAVYGETNHQGAAITQWAVSNITWEKSEQFNVGLDFGFMNNKLSGSFDYYKKNTSDILLILAIPNSTGLSANYQNGAEMENKGWELVINWEDQIGDFSYYVTAQLDDNKNKVTNLLGTGPYINNDRIRQVGTEFDALYGWESVGLLSKSDLDDPNVPKHNSSNIIEGSLKFKNQNDDDVIDEDDRVVIGSETPRYNYSFLTGFNYKGIGLDIILQGVGKRDGYIRRTDQKYGDYLYEWESDFYLPADHKIFTEHNYGQFGLEPNTNASLPAIGSDKYLPFSDYWIKSRAYLRVKNVTLSYTLPKSLINKIGLGNVRLYVSGENLYTFHNFIKGFDPELASGKGFWQYPNITKVIGGINISF